MPERMSVDEYFLRQAILASARGTCARRKVGCVLLNERRHVIATGYNGPASGDPHCIESPCEGARLPSGQGLDLCEAIHAEQNALLQCADVWAIHTAYCSAAPCITCVKLLRNTSCRRIVFATPYPHYQSQSLWTRDGREWVHLPIEA